MPQDIFKGMLRNTYHEIFELLGCIDVMGWLPRLPDKWKYTYIDYAE